MTEVNDAPTFTPRRVLLAAGVVVVVLVAVILWFVRHADSAPDTPRAAAQQWAEATVQGHADDAGALVCRTGVSSVLAVAAMTATTTQVTTGSAVTDGKDRWKVPVAVGPGGGDSDYVVVVVRQGGKYLVCD